MSAPIEPSPAGWPGVPDRPQQFLPRPALLDRLDAAQRCSLVLISAPAGTGKTTLVADWVSSRAPHLTEWVTLDDGDAFWPGLVGCLDRMGLQVPLTGLPTGDAALDPDLRRRLALAVASAPDRVTVVIDGYEVRSGAVATDLDYLLKHSGHLLCLVLLARTDPVMPLYRYRLDEAMVEVRMPDLAFDDRDAAELLGAMGVHLSPADVHTLNARARGWVTGLRFAGQSLAEAGPEADVVQIAGASGSIAEYLMGEVLAAQPPQIREQLMALSIPDTIQPGLAEVLAGPSAERTLASLVRTNVFIEPVTGRPAHYRFHPFFRELLRAELAYRSPAVMSDLQRRAADWYAEHGMLGLALPHHVAAGGWTLAAEAVVCHGGVGQLLLGEGAGALAQTLRELPADAEGDAPALVRATLAILDHDTTRADAEIARLGALDVDAGDDQRLGLTLVRHMRARGAPDPRTASVEADAAEVLPLPRDTGDVLGAFLHACEGLVALRLDQTDRAAELLREAAAVGERAAAVSAHCLGLLGVLACSAGELGRAHALAMRGIGVAEARGIPAKEQPSATQVTLAWVALEQFDLRTAAEHVRAAERARSILADPVADTVLVWLRARLQLAQGDRTGAVARLQDALSGLAESNVWLSAGTRLEIAHSLVVRGEPDAALAAVDQVADSPSAACIRGRALVDLGQLAAAEPHLAKALDPSAPLPVRIAALLVESERLIRVGDESGTRASLRAAVALARDTGVRRPFHEATPAVRHVLARDHPASDRHLGPEPRGTVARPHEQSVPLARVAGAPVEALTAKELEVLGHLAELLTTEEIAAVMFISVNTVRTHVRNVLRKLGVSRRNAAVRMARELELIGA